jgi:hypothetical protein
MPDFLYVGLDCWYDSSRWCFAEEQPCCLVFGSSIYIDYF